MACSCRGNAAVYDVPIEHMLNDLDARAQAHGIMWHAWRYVRGLTSGVMKPRMTSIVSKALFAMSGMRGQMRDIGRRATRGELTTIPKARTICNTSHNRVKPLHDRLGRV